MDTLLLHRRFISASTIILMLLCIRSIGGNVTTDTQRSSRVKRVVNGAEIEISDWPWLVHLWAKTKTGGLFNRRTHTHYCGGSIIADKWILSAAHCFNQGPGNQLLRRKKWHIRSGEREWQCDDLFDGVKHVICRLFDIPKCRCHLHNEEIFIHPEYNARNLWNNDIALIKLESGILSRRNTGVIKLPPSDAGINWPEEGAQCVAKGWGCTRGGGTIVGTARAVSLPIYPNSRCAVYYSGASDPLDITTRLCAYEFGSSICSGDSGGPLVCKNDNNEWVQAGIVSFAATRYPEYSPSVFARVSKYRTWIENIIRNN